MADDDPRIVHMRRLDWKLLPPPKDCCQVCGRKHDPSDPHDATQMYYQCRYFLDQGSWPTWKTALAHCSDRTKRLWETELRRRGAWTE